MPRNQEIFLTKTKSIIDLNKFNDEMKLLNNKIISVLKFEDNLRFTLSEILTVEEESIVDAAILNFVDTVLSVKVPKIYSLVKNEAKSKHHHNIDYKIDIASEFNLIPKRVVTKGEVTQVKWFKTLDASMVPTDLVLKVDIVYTRDITGFATYRTTVRTWINEDESEHEETKTTVKYYFVNPSDMITEGYKRRKLLVQSIQIPTLTFMSEALMPSGHTQESVVLKGRHFMDDYESDFSKFIENSSTITDPADANFGKKTVIVELENDSPTGRNEEYNLWLDQAPPSLGGLTTIRQYLINEFDI